ncbi:MAG: hypothetical protein M3Q33_02000 [Acidobacteriota bacterium]|nr:hypothetical protein [Acidobacteriota bacterium]
MSQRNKNNSIIFLTTLSVCLGLVLVGGTPSILTYAALTRNFDIQNEIEVNDDLDNKPDNEETESFSKDDFPLLFAQLLNEIKERVDSGKISLPLQTNFNVEGEFHKSEFSGGGGIGSNVSNQHLSLLIQNTVNQSYKPKAFELADYDNEKSKTVKIRLEANSTDFSLKVSFGKSKAKQFAEFLNQDFSSSAVLSENTLTKQIYENTNASSENNQVFIVTRLPRGSLSALLAKDAQ